MKIETLYVLYALIAISVYGEFTATTQRACDAGTSTLSWRQCQGVFVGGGPVAVGWPFYIAYRIASAVTDE